MLLHTQMNGIRALHFAIALVLCAPALSTVPPFPEHLVGTTDAVAALLERVIPGSASHFVLSLAPACPGVPPGQNCFMMRDSSNGTHTVITGTTASELSAGVGLYLREYCGMTFGWERGGGSRVFTPKSWPRVGASAVVRPRTVPYSHVTQVCTHSYTLVWHDWAQWERFIDWMALAGHNSIIAPTGQEEVQYKVLTEQFGVSDMEVRNWTNGPAWLTWSRGQNSHGNGIGGPLPRSFMKGQWALQRRILERYRELGIVGHLPAFGGYAPWALAVAQNATARIARGVKAATDTAWIDGRDPLYTRVADAWVAAVRADFGSDHVWQMDGFFANGTSWGAAEGEGEDGGGSSGSSGGSGAVYTQCEWSAAYNNTYLAGYMPGGYLAFPDLAAAQAACTSETYVRDCGGVVSRHGGAGPFELRAGAKPIAVPASDGEASYVVTNRDQCVTLPPDELWRNRSASAFGAVARADGPSARWIYQGYALGIGFGSGPAALARLRGFTEPIPQGQFILLDMDAEGRGEWQSTAWRGQWKLPFIWTALHDYGGDMGIKGNLSEINAIPFAAPPLAPVPVGFDPLTQAVGVGYTPEGLDQNPAYYELLQEAAFKLAPEPNITTWLVRRAHRRYGLWGAAGAAEDNADVAAAWAALAASGYGRDEGVNDGSGVCQMGVPDELRLNTKDWDAALRVPTTALCRQWDAWGAMLAAAPAVAKAAAGQSPAMPEPFTYDLLDVSRQVLAELSSPLLLNFSHALVDLGADSQGQGREARINSTGALFVGLLEDMDRLLGTDAAFMLGPWLAAARKLGGAATDCVDTQLPDDIGRCDDYMEWCARAQLTTWYPTLSADQAEPGQQGGRDHDYARKQWSGLIAGVHIPRAKIYWQQALRDAAAGVPFDKAAAVRDYARLSFQWQTDYGEGKYPVEPTESAVAVSTALRRKWAPFFSTCGA